MEQKVASGGRLPGLPFELQVQIFSQIPAQYIFSLRCVSRAWHAMLNNPHLETALLRLYPFLTTASSFAALTKRRLRIIRNDPVSVTVRDWALSSYSKPAILKHLIHDSCEFSVIARTDLVEPFQQYISALSDADHRTRIDLMEGFQQSKFWDAECTWPRVLLEIADRRRTDPKSVLVVDLDVLAQKEFPDAYLEYKCTYAPATGFYTFRQWTVFHLQADERRVLVGFRAAEWESDEPDGILDHFPAKYCFEFPTDPWPRKNKGLYLLLLERQSGNLIRSWTFTPPFPHYTIWFSALSGNTMCLGWCSPGGARKYTKYDDHYQYYQSRDACLTTHNITTGERMATIPVPLDRDFPADLNLPEALVLNRDFTADLNLPQAFVLDAEENIYFPSSPPQVNKPTVLRCYVAATGAPHPTADGLHLPPPPPVESDLQHLYRPILALGRLSQDPSVCYAFQLNAWVFEPQRSRKVQAWVTTPNTLIRSAWCSARPESSLHTRVIPLPSSGKWGTRNKRHEPDTPSLSVPEEQMVALWGTLWIHCEEWCFSNDGGNVPWWLVESDCWNGGTAMAVEGDGARKELRRKPYEWWKSRRGENGIARASFDMERRWRGSELPLPDEGLWTGPLPTIMLDSWEAGDDGVWHCTLALQRDMESEFSRKYIMCVINWDEEYHYPA